MKHFLSFIILITISASFVGCYDDSILKEDVADLQNRVSALELLCNQMNNNIMGMQTIVNTLNNNDYITAVIPIKDGDKEIGYTISFLKGDPINIYHGQDGDNGTDGVNGSTPIVGIKQDTDGIWYWTLNGDWLLDDQGQMVRASGIPGDKGDAGNQGITPQLKIKDDYWYISLDNGETWTKLSKAKGEDGDSFFNSVDSSNDGYVIFHLIDGSTISVPKFKQLSLTLDSTSEYIASGETIVIGYTISGSGGVYQIQSYSQTGWHVDINKETAYSGIITITAPSNLCDGSVMIIVSDDFGNNVIRTIQLIASNGCISLGKEEYSINALGGNLDIVADSNVDLTVVIPTLDQSWIKCVSVAKTKAQVPYTVRIHIDENQGYDDRSSTILLRTIDGGAEKSITINQFQKNAIVLPTKSFEISYMNQTLDIPFQSNVSYTISTDSEWLKYIQTKALVDQLVTIDVTMNTEETNRIGHIKIKNIKSGIEQIVTVTQTGFPSTLFSIPDNNFKEYLLSKYDINMDGDISTNEAAKVTSIDCSGRNITSIEGINYFVNLKSLNCSNNSIVNLSLTVNSDFCRILY